MKSDNFWRKRFSHKDLRLFVGVKLCEYLYLQFFSIFTKYTFTILRYSSQESESKKYQDASSRDVSSQIQNGCVTEEISKRDQI
jgi:hypothetical protein